MQISSPPGSTAGRWFGAACSVSLIVLAPAAVLVIGLLLFLIYGAYLLGYPIWWLFFGGSAGKSENLEEM